MKLLELRRFMRDPERFMAWLASSESQYCGDTENPAGCPLARWLSDEAGEPVKVYSDHVELGGRRSKWVPAWMVDIVASLDLGFQGGPVPTRTAAKVMAAEFSPFAAMLRLVPPELGRGIVSAFLPEQAARTDAARAAYTRKR